jgi:peptide/nickel transport system substrate-binding protein
VLTRPRDLDAARRALREARYRNERVVMLSATDIPLIHNPAEVAADLMRRIGFNVDFQSMDWGTHIQRRTNRGPVDQGGWSAFCTSWEGLDVSVPGSHQPIRGHGAAAWAGWPTIPRLEELREEWFQAADIEVEKRIAEEIQRVVWQEVPFIPLGQLLPVQAYRRSLTGLLKGSSSLFWGVRRV